MDRRGFLRRSAGALATALAGAGGLPGSDRDRWIGFDGPEEEGHPFDPREWDSVRAQFAIADRPIDLSALYISSHPLPVREAIAEHRAGLDRDPTLYLMRHNVSLTRAATRAAARYLGAARRCGSSRSTRRSGTSRRRGSSAASPRRSGPGPASSR